MKCDHTFACACATCLDRKAEPKKRNLGDPLLAHLCFTAAGLTHEQAAQRIKEIEQ